MERIEGNKIYQGDARRLTARLAEVLQEPIHLIVTDPPFGIGVQMKTAVTPEGKARNKKIANDEDIDTALATFDTCLRASEPLWGDELELYVFTAWTVGDIWKQHLEELGRELDFMVKMKLIWAKGYPGQGDVDGNWGCGYEEIFYCKRGRRRIPLRRSAILHVDKLPARQNIHPTEKPVGILEPLIEMSSDPGDVVLDFFSGSGSTSEAAMRTGRRSIAFELDQEYVDKGNARLEQTTLF